MLTRKQLLARLGEVRLRDTSKRVFIKVLDYSENPMATEDVAYAVAYTDLAGIRQHEVYYPDTVGFQGISQSQYRKLSGTSLK